MRPIFEAAFDSWVLTWYLTAVIFGIATALVLFLLLARTKLAQMAKSAFMTAGGPKVDYDRHARARRWRRWRVRATRAGGAILGLVLSIALVGVGLLLYQDHQHLDQLYRQGPGKILVEPAQAATSPSPTIAAPSPEMASPASPPRPAWAPGTWEADAAKYLDAHAYDAVSSVTPPPRHPRRGLRQ